MPEGGMSRARLRAHLRRCWAVYLVGAVAVLLLNNLIYTVTRPRASEEETLRVMLLNVDWEPDGGAQAALLEEIQARDGRIRALELESIVAAREEDPQAGMLLTVKLVAGYGDVYVTDAEGFALLADRAACQSVADVEAPGWEAVECIDPETGARYPGALRSGAGLYIVVASNGTNIESTLIALPLLAAALAE